MPYWHVHFGLKVGLSDPELVKLVERAHALSSVIREIPIPPYLQRALDTVNILRAVRGNDRNRGFSGID